MSRHAGRFKVHAHLPDPQPPRSHQPLRSIPLIRPSIGNLRRTPQQEAEWALAIARRDVPLLEQRFAAYCAALGQANRMRGPMRRHWQTQAFRQINAARAQFRAARKALVAAETAMLAFAPAVAA